ncbi:Coenzyme F420 hydrogenase/dehydrogenase, beta subunit C-terminal domain [Desulfitobacterium sp. THU1]|uniref:Coenzyme F420 hydrogenase/dehydrogenase, beta subunit C-terminal domain n=1 Tax=Desulfitobacterium sp. THU1 TaxID=3138072 RepID=UPI00311E4633
MVTIFVKREDCCGCTACFSVCPKLAITMKPDQEGFLYPHIDYGLCVECGLCQKVCAFQNGYETLDNFSEPEVYAIKHKTEEIRAVSTSGGMFTALTDEILAWGGVVYGVGYDDNMVVYHQRAEDADQRNTLRGSKYVQSEMRQTFSALKKDLRAGRRVLFTGTPCQVAGLRDYLYQSGADISNLILCDIVCHGTPSPLIFAEYLKVCEAKRGKKIVNHFCRSKVEGWHAHVEMNVFSDGQEDYKSFLSQLYKKIFQSHIAYRPACHNCKYTNLRRPSDITIADFWGVDQTLPEVDDNKGVSLVLINSGKGKKIFEKICSRVLYIRSNAAACLQPNLEKPTQPSPKRDEFWQNYKTYGFAYVIKKYFGYGVKGDIRRLISKILRNTGLLPTVKKVLGK